MAMFGKCANCAATLIGGGKEGEVSASLLLAVRDIANIPDFFR